MAYGIEYGSEEFRKKYLQRTISNQKILEKINTILVPLNIEFSVNAMIGFPEETRELIFDTIKFMKQIPCDSITVSIFTPYRGAAMREMAIKKGYLDSNVFTKHTTSSSISNMPQLTSKEIDGLFKTFNLYVHFDEKEWKNIEKIEKFEDKDGRIFNYYSERFRKEKWNEE